MEYTIFQVDAFTSELFCGNPAAVVPLEKWLDTELMQKIAFENNLSETAFFVPTSKGFHIRWFTPIEEVDLCGHATLASSFVIFNHLSYNKDRIYFESQSGELIVDKTVDKKDALITLNFPARVPQPFTPPEGFLELFPHKAIDFLFNKSTVLVFESEEIIRNMEFDIKELLKFKTHGVIITAKGNEVDFVSRFFAPDCGIDEDPVTGYAHTILVPYWSAKLEKKKLHALQVSKRGGELFLENLGDRVTISGNAIIYSKGYLYL
ncbi:MAG: PhzF family phenazine biosynthesis protein [Melioribacteraceae bacterium]|nr:PhzF family phenazine biosynthesis protein [Melioribacteraceae bacterium]